MMYTNLYPQDVDRLVLVAPAGFNEPWYRVITHAGRFSANALIRSTRSWLLRLLGHAHLISDTPRYGNLEAWFDTPTARLKPILLVTAAFDELHRADAHVRCREEDPLFRTRTILRGTRGARMLTVKSDTATPSGSGHLNTVKPIRGIVICAFDEMYALMGVSPMEAAARIKKELIDTIGTIAARGHA
ncbi:hypothetical protein T492DRAFT_877354 [Pavlovales sp. CCMP2436]|nr:hypothetical protein T492DRAFT_877354 [Pavlovales sp. CCMP2436]